MLKQSLPFSISFAVFCLVISIHRVVVESYSIGAQEPACETNRDARSRVVGQVSASDCYWSREVLGLGTVRIATSPTGNDRL